MRRRISDMTGVRVNVVLGALVFLGLAGIGAKADAAALYLSQVGVVGGGAAVFNPAVTHGVSDGSGSLFIWSTDDQAVSQSLSLNIRSSAPGVIGLTGATVFNPFVDVGVPALSGNRWQGTGGGTVAPGLITNVVGVAVTEGFGLDPGVAGFDPLYDSAAGAWLVARIDYDVLALGTSTIGLAVGPVDIVDGGSSVAGTFDFGNAEIEVVPEPSTCALLGVIGTTVLSIRRRRTTGA